MLSWFSSWKKRTAFVAGTTFENFLKYFRFKSILFCSKSRLLFANSLASCVFWWKDALLPGGLVELKL